MTKPSRKPSDPMTIMRRRLAPDDHAWFDALARQPDMRFAADLGGNLVALQRHDVFSVMHTRKAITDEHLRDVRRLETDMAAAEGVDGRGAHLVSVDHSGSKGPLDRKLEGRDRVALAIAHIGPYHWKMFNALLSPQFKAQPTPWREIIARETGEQDPAVQAYMVRFACAVLTSAYIQIDNSPGKSSRRPLDAEHSG